LTRELNVKFEIPVAAGGCLAAVLPPIEYDYPPTGDVIIQRGDKEKMEQECPKTSYPITFACAFRLAGTPEGKPSPYCRIVIANDEILRNAP
jgi:hypothetical protein